MKHFTEDRRKAIIYALQNAPTVAAALEQLDGVKYSGDQYRVKARIFKLDCIRLGYGQAFAAKFKRGRKHHV